MDHWIKKGRLVISIQSYTGEKKLSEFSYSKKGEIHSKENR